LFRQIAILFACVDFAEDLASTSIDTGIVNLQDGQVFVVKIMHGASLTEKAKEEVPPPPVNLHKNLL